MAGEQETFHPEEELRDKTSSHVLPQSPLPVSLVELGEVEGVFRAAEANIPVEPSIERWAQFNEHVMDQAVASLQQRPTFSQRRQILLDRFMAGDSRWKERTRVIIATVFLAVLIVVVYLVI